MKLEDIKKELNHIYYKDISTYKSFENDKETTIINCWFSKKTNLQIKSIELSLSQNKYQIKIITDTNSLLFDLFIDEYKILQEQIKYQWKFCKTNPYLKSFNQQIFFLDEKQFEEPNTEIDKNLKRRFRRFKYNIKNAGFNVLSSIDAKDSVWEVFYNLLQKNNITSNIWQDTNLLKLQKDWIEDKLLLKPVLALYCELSQEQKEKEDNNSSLPKQDNSSSTIKQDLKSNDSSHSDFTLQQDNDSFYWVQNSNIHITSLKKYPLWNFEDEFNPYLSAFEKSHPYATNETNFIITNYEKLFQQNKIDNLQIYNNVLNHQYASLHPYDFTPIILKMHKQRADSLLPFNFNALWNRTFFDVSNYIAETHQYFTSNKNNLSTITFKTDDDYTQDGVYLTWTKPNSYTELLPIAQANYSSFDKYGLNPHWDFLSNWLYRNKEYRTNKKQFIHQGYKLRDDIFYLANYEDTFFTRILPWKFNPALQPSQKIINIQLEGLKNNIYSIDFDDNFIYINGIASKKLTTFGYCYFNKQPEVNLFDLVHNWQPAYQFIKTHLMSYEPWKKDKNALWNGNFLKKNEAVVIDEKIEFGGFSYEEFVSANDISNYEFKHFKDYICSYHLKDKKLQTTDKNLFLQCLKYIKNKMLGISYFKKQLLKPSALSLKDAKPICNDKCLTSMHYHNVLIKQYDINTNYLEEKVLNQCEIINKAYVRCSNIERQYKKDYQIYSSKMKLDNIDNAWINHYLIFNEIPKKYTIIEQPIIEEDENTRQERILARRKKELSQKLDLAEEYYYKMLNAKSQSEKLKYQKLMNQNAGDEEYTNELIKQESQIEESLPPKTPTLSVVDFDYQTYNKETFKKYLTLNKDNSQPVFEEEIIDFKIYEIGANDKPYLTKYDIVADLLNWKMNWGNDMTNFTINSIIYNIIATELINLNIINTKNQILKQYTNDTLINVYYRIYQAVLKNQITTSFELNPKILNIGKKYADLELNKEK